MSLLIDEFREMKNSIKTVAVEGAIIFGVIMSTVLVALVYLDVRDALILPITLIVAISCLAYMIISGTKGTSAMLAFLGDTLIEEFKAQKPDS